MADDENFSKSPQLAVALLNRVKETAKTADKGQKIITNQRTSQAHTQQWSYGLWVIARAYLRSSPAVAWRPVNSVSMAVSEGECVNRIYAAASWLLG